MTEAQPSYEHYTLSRGLDLRNVDDTTNEEIATFRSAVLEARRGKLMYPLSAYSFVLENRPDMLKYHFRQMQQLHAVPGGGETGSALTCLTMLHWYACNRVEEGVIHEVRSSQREGASKTQINEVLALAFMHSGPSGFRTVYDQAFDYMQTYQDPATPIQFPPGWAPDLEAFTSGLDFSIIDLLDDERERLFGWYEATIGFVPRSVAFLTEHNPRFMKAHRGKFEAALSTGALPKQIVPYILIHYNMNRGFRDGIREAILLAKAWGMTKQQVINAITLGVGYMSGIDGAYVVADAAGDLLDSWE